MQPDEKPDPASSMTYIGGPKRGPHDYRSERLAHRPISSIDGSTPDEEAELAALREKLHRASPLVLLPEPPTPSEGFFGEVTTVGCSHPREHRGMTALRVFTYVLVCLTCLAVLYGMLEFYIWLNDLREALKSLADSFTADLFGNE